MSSQIANDVVYLRRRDGVTAAQLDAFDPTKAVRKLGRQWTYDTVLGNSGRALYATKREAIAGAEFHRVLLLRSYDDPIGYGDVTREKARHSIQIATSLQDREGMSEMEAYRRAHLEVEEYYLASVDFPEFADRAAVSEEATE